MKPGQTVMQAALAAGHYIPHLCYHPEFKPHGSCKLCTVKVNGRTVASCTMPAEAGLNVESEIEELNALRRTLVQMLFAEGNHFCPSCEKSGNCVLQALGYDLEVFATGFRHLYPDRPLDASHPDILLDFNRCILCELCVQRIRVKWMARTCSPCPGAVLPSTSSSMQNPACSRIPISLLSDKAMQVCPVGVILKKRVGFSMPIGERRYDKSPISAQALEDAPRIPSGAKHE